MTETHNDLGSRIREKLTQDEINRLQYLDEDALRALLRAVADTPMPDTWRINLQNLVHTALDDQRVQSALDRVGDWLTNLEKTTPPDTAPERIPTLAEKPWTNAEIAAAEAFTAAMGAAGYEQFAMGDGCGRLMHCIRAALMAANNG